MTRVAARDRDATRATTTTFGCRCRFGCGCGFDSIRFDSIDRATIDDGWMRLDRSIDRSSGTDRPVWIVRYRCVCVFRVFRVCDASIEDKKRGIPRITRIVSIDQPYRSMNRIDDRQTDERTNGRTDPIHRSIDSTRPHPSIDSTRPDASIEDDRRRPTTTDGPGRTARDGCASSSSSSSPHVVARGRGKEAR